MIAILDYGCGNLRSVEKAIEYIGYEAAITSSASDIIRATHIILPGVGAFRDAMDLYQQSGLSDALDDAITSGKPILGICLGMQLFMAESFEDGHHIGLGLFDAPVTRIPNEAGKVPHMGWNDITPVGDCPLFYDLPSKYMYFTHSYRIEGVHDWTCASCEYGGTFSAAIYRDNIFGVQFHPEKSGDAGLALLTNFARLGVMR